MRVLQSILRCKGLCNISAAKGIARAGAGKLKHLIVKHLRAQQLVGMVTAATGRVPRANNAADALTHYHFGLVGVEVRPYFCEYGRGVFDAPPSHATAFNSFAPSPCSLSWADVC